MLVERPVAAPVRRDGTEPCKVGFRAVRQCGEFSDPPKSHHCIPSTTAVAQRCFPSERVLFLLQPMLWLARWSTLGYLAPPKHRRHPRTPLRRRLEIN